MASLPQPVPHADVIVIGAGPAGLIAAAACADRGLRVRCVDPAPERAWPNTYGIWLDEATPRLLPACTFEATWPRAAVLSNAAEPLLLDRPYARVDRAAMRAHLVDLLLEAGGELVRAHVESVGSAGAHQVVRCSDRPAQRASLVVDASGPRPVALKRARGNPGVQTAYGVLAEIDGDPTGAGQELVLMDFGADHLEQGDPAAVEAADHAPPSFLYAMHMPDGRWFLEETVLVARPAWPIDDLRARLERRLAHRGARITRVFDEERCFIPMGDPLPALDQPVVGFGAAASFVHPATGYQLGRALAAAGPLADAIALGLGAGHAGHAGDTSLQLAVRAWEAVWPLERRRTRALYTFGMETLLTLTPQQTRAFFAAFFALPQERWQGYLADTLSPAEVATAMLRLFAGLGLDMKWQLARGALGENAALLWRGLRGG